MANEKKVNGSRILLAVNMGTTVAPNWKVALCQLSHTMNKPKNVIDASSKCGADSMIEDAAHTADFEGQILKVDAGNTAHLDTVALHQILDDGIEREWRTLIKDATAADNGTPEYSLTGYLSNLTDTFGNGEAATQSGSIAVRGKILVTAFEFEEEG